MKKPVLAFVISAAVLALTGCSFGAHVESESTAPADTTTITHPRDGWVVVTEDDDGEWVRVVKRCDKNTLMYVTTDYNNGSHSISTIPNSPECLG